MYLSIDINDKQICAIEGTGEPYKITVNRAVKLPIDPGALVEDGAVKNRLRLSAALSKVRALGKFTSKRVILTFSSSAILQRRLELPNSKPREIEQMARSEMIQLVGSPKDYVFDCASIGKRAGKENTNIVWAYAVPCDMVDGYRLVLAATDLKPVALDVHPNAVEKLFLNHSVNEGDSYRSLLFVEVEDKGVNIHLLAGGERAFSRISPVSTSELQTLIRNSGMKIESDLPLLGADFTVNTMNTDSIISEAINRYLNALAEEMRKIIQFQRRQNVNDPVTGVYLYGSLAHVPGLGRGLSRLLDLPVEPVRTVDTINAPAGFDPADYVNALGALVRIH